MWTLVLTFYLNSGPLFAAVTTPASYRDYLVCEQSGEAAAVDYKKSGGGADVKWTCVKGQG